MTCHIILSLISQRHVSSPQMCINIIIGAVTDHGSVKVAGVGKATYTHAIRAHISWFDLQLLLQCQFFVASLQNDHKQGRQLNPGAGRRIASPQADRISRVMVTTYQADLKQSQHLALLLLQRRVSVLLSQLFHTISSFILFILSLMLLLH